MARTGLAATVSRKRSIEKRPSGVRQPTHPVRPRRPALKKPVHREGASRRPAAQVSGPDLPDNVAVFLVELQNPSFTRTLKPSVKSASSINSLDGARTQPTIAHSGNVDDRFG